MQVALRNYRGRTPIYLHRICITRTLDVVTFSRSFVRSHAQLFFVSVFRFFFFSHLDCLKCCRGASRFRSIISLDLILSTAHSRHWHEIPYCILDICWCTAHSRCAHRSTEPRTRLLYQIGTKIDLLFCVFCTLT